MNEPSSASWILVVDSARKGLSLALLAPQGDRVYLRETPGARGEVLAQELESLLHEASLNLADVGSVVVALGPGSFTGLRTGIAFCEGLCAAGRRKLYGISSLALMRAQWTELTSESVGVLAHARPGFLYVGTDAGQWPHLEKDFQLSQEAFLSEADAVTFLRPCACVMADCPRPIEGPLSTLSAEWVDLSNALNLSVLLALLPSMRSKLLWNANYLQPSYAEQAPARA